MKRAALILVPAVLVGLAMIGLEMLSDPMVMEVRYPTRADAERDGSFARGWLPDFLPRSAQDIREKHSLDTNEICATFAIDRADGAALSEELARRDFAACDGAPPAPRRWCSPGCWFDPSCLTAGRRFRAVGRVSADRTEYVTVDATSGRVCYWTGSRS